jgi:hypothetical protein
MASRPVPEANPAFVQTNDRFHHVQVRPSEAFVEFRTPLAGETTLSMRADGYDVREGRVGSDRWVVESVLVPVDVAVDGEAATRRAQQVVGEMES